MIQRLVLGHFRNYERQTVEFAGGANALLGENGQGKTNILEAVYYLSLLRSFRTTQVATLLNSGTGSFSIYGEVLDANGIQTRLGVSNGAVRRLLVDGQPVRRSSDFISRLVCAPFLPEDLAIVKGHPGGRRRFLDIALCQVSQGYLRSLQNYDEALRSRNAMLKLSDRHPRNVATAYDHLLAEYASQVEIERRGLAERLNEAVERISKVFFPDGRLLAVNYLSGIGRLLEPLADDRNAIQEKYAKMLDEAYDRDARDGATRYGPHRSDLACMMNGRMLSLYGSEGECRAAAIALRLALLEILVERHGPRGVTILVDDVLGELDGTRRAAFLEQVTSSGQMIFAGTALPQGFPPGARVFQVRAGQVAQVSPD